MRLNPFTTLSTGALVMRYLSVALLLLVGMCVANPLWATDDDTEETVSEQPTDAASDETQAPASSQSQESVVFDGATLNLAWQGNNPGETVKEFIPAGQDLESWTKLASIREYDELDDVPALIGAFVRIVKERYPRSPVQIFENDETGAVMLEFTVWPGAGEMRDAPFVEYNIFKYEKQAAGGVVAQQYALREYRQIDDFVRKLEPIKKRLLDEMGNQGLQVIKDEQAEADDEEESEGESDQ